VVADPDLEELPGERGLDLVGVEVEGVRADADEADVEDEVRVRPAGDELDERGLGRDGRRVQLEPLEAGLPLWRSPPPVRAVLLVEGDGRTCRHGTIQRHRLGGTG
jgi:hypothetical protein